MVCSCISFSSEIAFDLRTGIWDCLTSQQGVDFVRLLISEGHELSEITEIVCADCLAPDPPGSGYSVGHDNMTIFVVALLNGKTMEEWRGWVTDRVKNHIGYPTPKVRPQIYSQSIQSRAGSLSPMFPDEDTESEDSDDAVDDGIATMIRADPTLQHVDPALIAMSLPGSSLHRTSTAVVEQPLGHVTTGSKRRWQEVDIPLSYDTHMAKKPRKQRKPGPPQNPGSSE